MKTEGVEKLGPRAGLGGALKVLLVKPSYVPAATILALPQTGGDIIAIAREAARR